MSLTVTDCYLLSTHNGLSCIHSDFPIMSKIELSPICNCFITHPRIFIWASETAGSHALELYSTLIVIRFCQLSQLWCQLCFLTGLSHWVGERLHFVHLPTLVHHPLTYLTTKTAAGSLCCATTTGGLEWVLLLLITSVEANTHQYFVLSGKGQQDCMALGLKAYPI